MVEQELFIGTISKFDPSSGIGEIHMAGSSQNLDKEFYQINYIDSEFQLKECYSPFNIGRIVVYYNSYSKFDKKNWAHNIKDFDPKYHSYLSKFISKGLETNPIRLPENNPHLFEYFIENNIIYQTYQRDIKKIKDLELVLKTIPIFESESAINSYKVRIKESTVYRRGNDDSAYIYISAERKYFENDPYLNSLLPTYSIDIASDRYYASGSQILNGLWEELGGDNKKKELEIDCIKRENEAIEAFKLSYNRIDHFNYNQLELNKLTRILRGSIEAKYRAKELYY